MTMLPISEAIAKEAAQLRASRNLRMPDALQLATAIRAGATYFLTNDAQLPQLPAPRLLVLNQLAATSL